MLPRAQYATHLFDTDSDRSSCEADAVALKYLKVRTTRRIIAQGAVYTSTCRFQV